MKFKDIFWSNEKIINKDIFEKYKDYETTNDVVTGDVVVIAKRYFKGKFPESKYDYTKIIECEILKESYGKEKGQHTFTCLNLENNEKFLIKGRNLYPCVFLYSKKEEEREELLKNKHERSKDIKDFLKYRKYGIVNDV